MKTAVLVEKLGKNKYRASTSQPIALESEGRSREEAVKRLCALARKRLAAGEWRQVSLPGPSDANPWIAYAGVLKMAAIAMRNGATLVTCNLRDFKRLPGVTLEDWSSSQGNAGRVLLPARRPALKSLLSEKSS